MVIFRHHRGTLSEAMATAIEFESVLQMKQYILKYYTDNSLFDSPPFSIDDIVLGDQTLYDRRIGWQDTRHVMIKKYYNDVYPFPQCIGFCATIYPK